MSSNTFGRSNVTTDELEVRAGTKIGDGDDDDDDDHHHLCHLTSRSPEIRRHQVRGMGDPLRALKWLEFMPCHTRWIKSVNTITLV